MSIITTLETEGQKAWTAIEAAGAWLVGVVAQTEHTLTSLEASSPLVAEAVAAGEAAATAHGVPVVAVENIGEAVITAAKELAAGLTVPPPATQAKDSASQAANPTAGATA